MYERELQWVRGYKCKDKKKDRMTKSIKKMRDTNKKQKTHI